MDLASNSIYLCIYTPVQMCRITLELLTSVMRIPGRPTGTGSNFVPGELFSTQRTNPTAPRAFAVSETFLIDAEPTTKLKEYPQRRILPFIKFLFKSSGLWQSVGLYFITEESSNTSFAATNVYVSFKCVEAVQVIMHILATQTE